VLVSDAVLGGYDAILACLGNSEFHAGALRALRRATVPVSVLCHDAAMTGLYRHGVARGAVPEGWERALAAMYPERAIPDTEAADAASGEVLMVREVVARAERVLMTSELAADLVRADVAAADAARVDVLPFAYPPPVGRDPVGVEPGLVCSFGLVNATKQPELLIAAVALVRERHPDTRLVFVGPAGAAEHAAIAAAASDLGVADHVEVTGAVARPVYDRWLARAGTAVQLRTVTNGETSGAVADCLARGIPTVVTAIGTMATLGAAVAALPAGTGPAGLAAELDDLRTDPDRRRDLAAAARALCETNSFARTAAIAVRLLPGLHPG
jgi:glycosyltransferase involved in cell wall biosynthesis